MHVLRGIFIPIILTYSCYTEDDLAHIRLAMITSNHGLARLTNSNRALCLIMGCGMQVEHGRLPGAYSTPDADKLIAAAAKIAQKAGSDVEELDKDVLRQLAWTAGGDLSPMAAIFGGIVGQEAVKAVTGKFHPIEQFLYFDAVEALPSEPLSASEAAPQVSLA